MTYITRLSHNIIEVIDKLPRADIFIALFRAKAGKYTMEEINAALESHKQSGKPVGLYCFVQDYDGEREFSPIDLKEKLDSKFLFLGFDDKES
jgi:hypothetical protein